MLECVARHSTRNCRQGPTRFASQPATTTAYGTRQGQVSRFPFHLHSPRASCLRLFVRSPFWGCRGFSTPYGYASSPHRSERACMSGSRSAPESPESCMTRCCRAFRGYYSTFKELVTYFLSAQRKRFKLWTERWMVRNRRLWKDGTRFMTYDHRHLLRGDWWRKSRVLEKNLSPRTEIRMRHSSEW